jgi:hypothetical protein
MNSNTHFTLFIIYLVSFKNLTNGSSYDQKNWESICSIFSCQPVFDTCILNQCFGIDSCRACVKTQNQNCLRCVDGIINEQYFSINGTQTIICDSINSLHETTCNFYCRMNEKENWKCETIGGYPLCNCYGPNLISTSTITTTKPTTTTTDNSNQPQLLSKIIFVNKPYLIMLIRWF